LLEKIGEGASGNVFKTRCRRTNEIRAVKILKKNFLKKLGKD
jgi:serine/threonine protein kinase